MHNQWFTDSIVEGVWAYFATPSGNVLEDEESSAKVYNCFSTASATLGARIGTSDSSRCGLLQMDEKNK